MRQPIGVLFQGHSWLSALAHSCPLLCCNNRQRPPSIVLHSHPQVPDPKVKSESHSVMSDSLRPHGLCSPWNSPGQNTGVGRLSLLQGIFPTQGSDPGLPHCRQIIYQVSHKGSPRILEWVAYPFSNGSSKCRN